MRTFEDLKLIKPLLKIVSEAGYSRPTPIQSLVIPAILSGKDVMASSITGSGKTAATVAGVAGGALIGREIDKNRQTSNPYYTVRVRLNNGDYQTMNLDGIGELRTGDRVRIENNQLYRY